MRVFVIICPIKVNTCKNIILPIWGDDVMFLEGVEQVLAVAFANAFDTKVVHDKSKTNWAPFVAPESRIFGGFIIPGFVQTDAEKIII